jgi:hypothetical protein
MAMNLASPSFIISADANLTGLSMTNQLGSIKIAMAGMLLTQEPLLFIQ